MGNSCAVNRLPIDVERLLVPTRGPLPNWVVSVVLGLSQHLLLMLLIGAYLFKCDRLLCVVSLRTFGEHILVRRVISCAARYLLNLLWLHSSLAKETMLGITADGAGYSH